MNGIPTHDLFDTGAVHYQLSYQANWELVTLYDLSYIHLHAFVWAFAYYEFTNFNSEKIPFEWK